MMKTTPDQARPLKQQQQQLNVNNVDVPKKLEKLKGAWSQWEHKLSSIQDGRPYGTIWHAVHKTQTYRHTTYTYTITHDLNKNFNISNNEQKQQPSKDTDILLYPVREAATILIRTYKHSGKHVVISSTQ